jgi:anti-sigma regulatory factor (Ser/Thr protein kinase)
MEAESIPQAVWTHDSNGRIDYVNRRFRDYFEFGLGGVTDMLNWSSVIHPVDFDRAMPVISRSLACGIAYEAELRLKPLSAGMSSFRLHLMRIVPVAREGGNVTKWVGSLTDIHSARSTELDTEGKAHVALEDDVVDLCLDAKDVLGVHKALNAVMGFIRMRAGLQADYQAIRLIYFELIGNVMKYAPGRFMLRIDWFGDAPYLHVFDRGRGFEYSPMLPTDILAEGGRGLYLVNSLAGSLSIHRLPGCGSHVSVRLPARRHVPRDASAT